LLVPRTPAGRFVAVLAALACSAALVGCQANPEPAPLPSESPSATAPSEADSPSPAPPTMPAEASGTSEKSAKAFVRFYIDALNFATATGDTHVLQKHSDQACDSCNSVVERIVGVYDAGGHIESQGWRIRSMTLVPLQPRHRPVLDVGLRLLPQLVIEEAGAEPQKFEGGKLPATFHLAFAEGYWTVTKWDRAV
jgi:hypothetical protein